MRSIAFRSSSPHNTRHLLPSSMRAGHKGFLFFFRIMFNFTITKTLTLLVHAGLVWCFHNPKVDLAKSSRQIRTERHKSFATVESPTIQFNQSCSTFLVPFHSWSRFGFALYTCMCRFHSRPASKPPTD